MVSKKVQRKAQEKIARLQKKMGPDWKPSESLAARAGGVHLTTVSKRRAEEMGLSETERHGMTPEEYKKAEKGQVDLGKPTARELRQQTEADRITKLNEEIAREKADVRPTIKLTPKEKEKTGISKLREEDSIIGAAVRVATDWRTTVALVGTLASIAGLGAVIGGGAAASRGLISASVSVHRVSAMTGKLIPMGTAAAQRAIIGKPAASGVGKLFKAGAMFASNTKTRAMTTSVLAKAGMSVGAAALIATSVGTYPFAEFELAEACDKIGIAIFQAANAGDAEEVARLQEYLDEMTNPSVWDSIVSKIPFANVINNVRKNIAAAQVSAASIRESSQEKLAATTAKEGEPTFAEERETADIEARERKEEWRKEDEEYFEKIEKKKQAASEEERKEDEAYYTRIAEEKREKELSERKEDEKYYARLRTEAEERKTAERKADEEYWAKIYAANEKRKSGEKPAVKEELEEIKGEELTPEEKEIIDNWNAGKSALNFKWLGL